MAARAEPRPLPRHPRVWWSRIAYRWPFVVWLAAVAACAFLYLHSGQTASVSGVIEVQREEAAPIEAARLVKVHVVPGQAVQAGDLLAEFDAAVLDAEMHEIQAQFALDQLQTERQFTRAITEAEARVQVLGPEILALPTRVSPIQGQTLRGRRVVLELNGPADFLPGESVNIHFSKPWWMDKYQSLLERYTRQTPAAPPGAS